MIFNRQQWILRALRRLSYRYPLRSQALKDARIRHGWYTCAICKEEVKSCNKQLDHKIPVAGDMGFIDWNDHIDRLLPKESTIWQVLCLGCHQKKTNEENERRRANRKLKK